MDEWARRLVELYPAQGRVGWNLVESLLFTVLTADPAVPPAEAWAALQARLEAHTRSHQWRIKRMIPRLDRWLRDGAHLQELPADASPSDQLSPRSARTLAAASKLLGEA
jgi:hypothetical protein